MPNIAEKTPTVSVVMTAYNGSQYIRSTIDSILAQSFADFEFVIVDDCSKDDTRDIIQSYSDPRIVFVPNQKNLGISESRNLAIQCARGTYVASTDQDDVSQLDRLKRQVDFLDRNADVAAVASRVYLLRGDKRVKDPMPVQQDPLLIHFAMYLARHNTTYSSLCMRADFLRSHNLFFDKRFHYAEDFELMMRMGECGRLAILSDELVGYRLHPSNNSTIHYDEMSRNGMTFMRAAYSRAIGREVNYEEGWVIWRGLIEKKPCESAADLSRLGRILLELTRCFIETRSLSPAQSGRVRTLAAEIWNDIADRSSARHGLAAEAVRWQVRRELGIDSSIMLKVKKGSYAVLRSMLASVRA